MTAGIDTLLDRGAVTLGSAANSTIVLDNPLVGKHQLLLRRRGGEWTLEVLGLTDQPVYLNGIRVIGHHLVRVGDVLEVGPAVFSLESAAPPPAEPRSHSEADRRLWLGGSAGLLLALITLALLLSRVGQGMPEQSASSVTSPVNTPVTPAATVLPSPTARPTTLPTPAPVGTRAITTPSSGTTEAMDRLEAHLSGLPHGQVVAAYTALARLDDDGRATCVASLDERVLPAQWVETLLATPTPVPPMGRIGYARYLPEAARYDLFIANLGTGMQHQVLAEGSQPAYAPGGQSLAYRSLQADALGLYAATGDGSGRWRLTSEAHPEDQMPDWSPDGQAIAFASRRFGDGMSRVYTVPSQGGDASEIAYGEHVDWSPDGTHLVLKTCQGGSCGLMLALPDGSELQPLTSDASDGAPCWSPNGQYIAFHSHRQGKWGIYVMRADGTGLLSLSDGTSDNAVPVWSPDGQYIAFRSDRSGEWSIWAVPASGGTPDLLFSAPVAGEDWLTERLAWLP